MTYQHVKVHRQGHIATLQFNRPKKANALSHAHLEEIEGAILSFREDTQTRVVIFTGSGNHFSSGADLSDELDVSKMPLVQRRRQQRAGERCIEALLKMDQITIAAWRGAAMGGGACIATACDFRVGAIGCFMRYPEIDIGLNLMWKSLPLIINLAGLARAKRLVIGGEHITDHTLLAWGILDELVAENDVMQACKKMALHYAAKPPVAAQMIKQSANQIAHALNHAIMHMDVDQNLLTAASEDRARAITAYRNKKPTEYDGN